MYQEPHRQVRYGQAVSPMQITSDASRRQRAASAHKAPLRPSLLGVAARDAGRIVAQFARTPAPHSLKFVPLFQVGPGEALPLLFYRKVREIRKANPQPASQFSGPAVPETNSITASTIDGILNVKGQVNAGMYKVASGRKAAMHGKPVGNQMGVNTWAAFAGTDAVAFVDGDFAMLESELQPVLKALRRAGIHIVAIHNHMTDEEPQFVFLHYWGKGRRQAWPRVGALCLGPIFQRFGIYGAR